MTVHSIEKCYKLNGYPLGHELHGKTKNIAVAVTHPRAHSDSDYDEDSTESIALTKSFSQSKADYSLFTREAHGIFVAILVYVDDILVASNDLNSVHALKSLLHSKFKIKDLGKLRYFLGTEIARSSKGIYLCQRKYTLDILADSGNLGSNIAKVPMEQNLKLTQSTGIPLSDSSVYRRMIGRLLYLTISRPDISFSIQTLSQFLATPTDVHLLAAQKVLRYLKVAPGQGLFLPNSSSFQLEAYCNSNWVSCPNTKRSINGYCVFLGSSLISWKSKKQAVVSQSSAEAEYHSMAATCSELMWLRFILAALQVHHPQAILLYCDNQAAIHIVANPIFHERTKHIELDHHLIRDRIQEGNVCTRYVPRSAQVANTMTKVLSSKVLHIHLSKMGVVNLYASSCGGVLENESQQHTNKGKEVAIT
ncbi:hypothetical protein F2P56_012478 [Juglans regia]|uniref:Reverse transcriptase Ty1/copia-type domain-containing protein n=2 Tax=Juglans regia TaxID=51240 RepID=A0A833XMB1_JUGRE|nr:uncharacterized mitochondrial protein AtMg00810-like [Juglans regia]KAF5468319.1 hypothetical protein F2P56_012478 [Juglans regia]